MKIIGLFSLAFSISLNAAVPVPFNHLMKIKMDGKAITEGDTECLEFAATVFPSETNQTKFSSQTSTCGAVEKDFTSLNASCTQPWIMSGLFDFKTNKFWLAASSFKPARDKKDRTWVWIRMGTRGLVPGTFEVRGIDSGTWKQATIYEKKTTVEVPYLCRIVLPTENTF